MSQLRLSRSSSSLESRREPLSPLALATLSAAVACVLGLVYIHLWLVPMHLEEKRYIGVLFIVASVLLLLVAVGLAWARVRAAAWWGGAAVCVGMAVGYVCSRTVGLPAGYHESWDDPWGTACLVLEGMYLLAMGLWLRGPVVRH
jgi:hypothetical protein